MDHVIVNLYWPLAGLGVLCLMMLALWFVQLRTNNAGVVDIGWAWGLVIFAGLYAAVMPGALLRRRLLFAMVLIWGLRLTWLLVSRFIRDGQEDRRYQKLRREFGRRAQLKFLGLFLVEGLLDMVLSLPFWLICRNRSAGFSGLEWAAVGLWAAAFAGEIISDEQMRRFKAGAANKNRVCREGLWKYSRHPNYFFEWMMWAALALWALAAPYGCLGLVAPAVMYYILVHVTGVTLAEEMALASKGQEYREYRQATSSFVPLPQKRGVPS
ncbi:MAG: DUF1295 domain-containing protein [Candidatus Omnitrophica bacterium]|nr:DUF1295 domain-containing protein [Candidatus Omnitrophota bacterium]